VVILRRIVKGLEVKQVTKEGVEHGTKSLRMKEQKVVMN
jgi:hypothetical protein